MALTTITKTHRMIRFDDIICLSELARVLGIPIKTAYGRAMEAYRANKLHMRMVAGHWLLMRSEAIPILREQRPRGPRPKHPICRVIGCKSKHYAHGYCRLHYQRVRQRVRNHALVKTGKNE